MQFLERSVIGLRAARHRLSSPDHAPRITLYPMVHVGEARFYDKVHAEARAHDLVLVEGVDSKIARNLTRAYRWLRVGRLGLVVQPKLAAQEDGPEVILADLSGPEFDTLWQATPAWERRLFSALAPVFGAVQGLTLSRGALARGMNQNDLSRRDDLLSWGDPFTALRGVLLEARDQRLCDRISELLTTRSREPISIAILYGAAHMPALLRCLRENWHYVAVDSEWITVFAGE